MNSPSRSPKPRALVVADVYLDVGGQVFTAARDGDISAEVPWKARSEAVLKRTSAAPVTQGDIGDGGKGAWIGIPLGLTPDAPKGALQVWRQYTTSFTEIETAMLADLARVASGAVERLKS